MAVDNPKEVSVGVTVPNTTKLEVIDLKNSTMSQQELDALIKKAAASKVGFVILNAPFKLRSGGPAA